MVSGTSVGALNGYFAACHDDYEVQRMTEIWTEMRTTDIYDLPSGGTLSLMKKMFQSAKLGALISNAPLRELILREASRRTLRESVTQGNCQAFIVSATHLLSGTNVLFVDSADPNYSLEAPPHGKALCRWWSSSKRAGSADARDRDGQDLGDQHDLCDA